MLVLIKKSIDGSYYLLLWRKSFYERYYNQMIAPCQDLLRKRFNLHIFIYLFCTLLTTKEQQYPRTV